MNFLNVEELQRLFLFLLRRIFQSIFVLFGLSILIFLLSRVLPGDPARMALGARAPQETIQRLRDEMHLDEPLLQQYQIWFTNALGGDLGDSLRTRRPVVDDIVEFLPASMELVLLAGVISAIGGITLGTLSARHKDSWIDNLVRVVSYMGVVTPAFVVAIIFLTFFTTAEFGLDLFPPIGRLSSGFEPPPRVTGLYTVDSLLAGQFNTFLDALHHLILPSLALALGSLSQEARITRSTMSDNLTRDYIAAERALGIPEKTVTGKFLLKPSLIPTVSIFGLDFAANLSNAFLVEVIFNWPGISRYATTAMLYKDLNAIAAVILILGVTFIVVNILVDLVVGILDPRIRLRGARSD
ncbi:MAG: ABC transporter permease [Anaerolineaceae bacterium]|nr:ABC transporter permease [Anaerolineaceae bacterium]